MKAKIILYGWVASLFPMIAGLGTMEWALETGEPVMLPGLGLFLVWVVFSVLVIRNRELVDGEMQRFEAWFDKAFIDEEGKPEQKG